MADILLLGLDDAAAQSIERILGKAGHALRREPLHTGFAFLSCADLIFLSADRPDSLAALKAILVHSDAPPVIAETHRPEMSRWLDAMEAGAANYCAEPFEPHFIHWLIDPILDLKGHINMKAMAA